MTRFSDILKLFLWNSKLDILRNMEYRFDFVVYTFISLFYTSVGSIVQLLIFFKTKGYPGWNINQIILFQGVLLFTFGINKIFFHRVRTGIDSIFRNGTFDRLLLKPYPPIAVIMSDGFYLQSISSVVAGLIVVIGTLNRLHIKLGVFQIILFLVFVICGLILTLTINIFYASISITLIDTQKIGGIFDKLISFKDYPLEVFSKSVSVVFLTILPLAVFVYIPAQVLLNRLNYKIFYTILCVFVLFCTSLRVWNICLKKYTSAGG